VGGTVPRQSGKLPANATSSFTTGLKCNRSLRIVDESQPSGWKWQRLSDYTASFQAEDYILLP